MDKEKSQPKIKHRSRRRAEVPERAQVRRMDGLQKPGLLQFLVQLIYKNLYILGITLLRRKNRAIRLLKHFFNRMRGRSYAKLEEMGQGFVELWKRILQRIWSPFHKLGAVRQQMRPVIEKSRREGKIHFRAYGKIIVTFFKLIFTIFRTLFNYAVPVIAALFLVMTVRQQMNRSVGLEVTYNNQNIGFIEHEADFEEAADILKKRYISEDILVMTPQFRIREAGEDEKYTEPKELANRIVEASGNEIEWGYGLYIENEFCGAVTDKDAIFDELDTIKENYSTGLEGEKVDFAKPIRVEDGLYPTSSIVRMNQLKETMYREETMDDFYTVIEGDSPSRIAAVTGVSMEDIDALNPGFVEEGVKPGQQILISKAVPFLPVKNIFTLVYEEDFAYEVEEIPTEVYATGYREVSVKGQPGIKEITAEVSRVNNIEIERTVRNTRILKDPITEKVIVGTNNPRQVRPPSSNDVSAKGFLWPTAGGYIGTGLWGYANHTGVDIPRPSGTPIFASAPGTVVVARNTGVGYGRYIIIDHHNGFTTYYAHCSALHVTAGQRVNQGDMIASVGRTGNATGNHLHFEVRYNNKIMNPRDYIG